MVIRSAHGGVNGFTDGGTRAPEWSSESKHSLGVEVVIRRGLEALLFDGLGGGGWCLFDQVQGELAQGVEIPWSVVAADAAVVLAEGDVQDPMQGVFDAPVGAHGVGELAGFPRRGW